MTRTDFPRAVVVTGGASAIGAAISTALAADGWPVIITYRHSAERARQLAETLKSDAVAAIAVEFGLDESESGSVGRLLDSASSAGLGIGGLVHNAVVWPNRSPTGSPHFAAQPAGLWRQAIDDNVNGSLGLLHELLPSIVSSPNGRVVLLSSNIAAVGMAGSTVYGAVKASLHGIARSLAWELGPRHATVNVVAPGLTATDRIHSVPQEAVSDVVAHTPIQRLVSPQEVAAAVAFLSSAAASGITGQLINVTGGTS